MVGMGMRSHDGAETLRPEQLAQRASPILVGLAIRRAAIHENSGVTIFARD